MTMGLLWPTMVPKLKASVAEANIFRGIFFVMTFFTIGVVSNFRKLWEAGIARLAAVYVLNLTRGVPLALLIFVGLVAAFDLVLRKTRAGRMVFAVGGNAEAARRAGIDVAAVRIVTFAVAAAMAAVGGVMQASRLFAVNQASGSGDVLLNAIAAAVIGGTSLFGGRGSAWSALLGMLVIGSIQSGILLLDLQSDAQYMITAAVLLVAVTVDALSRRGRKASGRA